jgi:DNA invertase Pin-like site-specific DNA recombinase
MTTEIPIHKAIEDALPIWRRIRQLHALGVRVSEIARVVRYSPQGVYRIINERIPEAEKKGWL